MSAAAMISPEERTGESAFNFSPLRRVPFVLCMSDKTNVLSPFLVMMQCIELTEGSGIVRSASSERPILTSSPWLKPGDSFKHEHFQQCWKCS